SCHRLGASRVLAGRSVRNVTTLNRVRVLLSSSMASMGTPASVGTVSVIQPISRTEYSEVAIGTCHTSDFGFAVRRIPATFDDGVPTLFRMVFQRYRFEECLFH